MRFATAMVVTLVAAAPRPALAQAPTHPPNGLATEGLSGEAVALLPLTLAVTDPALRSDTALTMLGDRRRLLLWADSIVSETLAGHAPEVNWIPPRRLRQMARRNPGMVPDPDQMGQAILRAPKLSKIPDPLRGSLRSLTAVTGGRYAMVPAALGLSLAPDGSVRADLSLALADSRSGLVVWRSATFGSGPGPSEAVTAAIVAILPATGP